MTSLFYIKVQLNHQRNGWKVPHFILIRLIKSLWNRQSLNCISPNVFSEFASVIRAQVGSSSEIVFKEAVEDDPQRRRPDISLAKKVLNWEPKVALETGIQKTIDYFKKELSRNHLTEKDSHEEIVNYQNTCNTVWKKPFVWFQNVSVILIIVEAFTTK